MTAILDTKSVMDQLRESTLEAHKSAEGHEFQRSLLAGRLPKDLYVANLGQLFLVHRSLERALRAAAELEPAIVAVVREYQYQEPYLAADLGFLGLDASTIRPVPAAARVIGEIEGTPAGSPLALLGMHYVLEGSKNGAKYICRAVLKAYGLAPGDGTRYLDPYADRQREYWEAFKNHMNAVGFTQSQIDVLIGAAGSMFGAVEGIGDDLLNGR